MRGFPSLSKVQEVLPALANFGDSALFLACFADTHFYRQKDAGFGELAYFYAGVDYLSFLR
ncbi:hypothetical protein ACX27_13195 [Nostoc piscinale CENA21]|uniref:Uncharacterized protein n=1 Tax=Nostoc piscinale CENA21 TaxID=224013 RepID=A0A0M3V5A5_9NOSO|nr:hypothetical protein ACX27_13195 [Nostoc piscinale CENA21]